MASITHETTQHVARRGLTALIIALGLVAVVLIDQSVHWLLERLSEHYEMPQGDGDNPGIWFLFSLFYMSAALFCFTVLYRRSEDIGALRRGAVLGASWSLATLILWLITLFLLDPLFSEFASERPPLDATLFVVDQIARGAFFDLFETMGWALTDVTHNPEAWWFSVTLVIFRAMTSVGSVVVLVRVAGLGSRDMGLG